MSSRIGIILNQTIYTSTNPTVIALTPEAEGEARFLITNKNPKTSMVYFKRTTDELWMNVILAYNESRLQIFTGTPNDDITVECYSKASDELPSETVNITTKYYLPKTTVEPTIIFSEGSSPGKADFTIINNDSENVQIFYKRSTEEIWNSDTYLNGGASFNMTLIGTAGTNVTLQAYAIAIDILSYKSITVQETGSYKQYPKALAPWIIPETSTVEGQVKFQLMNNESISGTIYYKRSTDGSYTSLEIGADGISASLTFSGTKGTEVTIEAYFTASTRLDSDVTSAVMTYFLPRTTTSPEVVNVPSTNVGETKFTIKNNDITKVRVYYKRTTDEVWNSSNTLDSGATLNVGVSGTPGESVTLQAYCQSETEVTYISTPTVTANGTYYKTSLLAPAITELSTEIEGDIKFQLSHNNSLAVNLYYRVGTSGDFSIAYNVPPFDVGNPASFPIFTNNGSPGTTGQVQVFSRLLDYYDSTTTKKDIVHFLPRTTSAPTVTNVPSTNVGETKFTITNNDISTVRVYHKRTTDGSWDSSSTLISGATLNVGLSGTPGEDVILEVYCVATVGTVYNSTTIEASGTYYKTSLLAPAITEISTTVEGQIKFQLSHNNSLAVNLYYRVGTTGEFTIVYNVPPFDVEDPNSFPSFTNIGTPGATSEVQVYSRLDDYFDSTVTKKSIVHFLPRTTAAPIVTGNPGTDAGWAVFNIKNEDATKVRVYYKRTTDGTWNSSLTLNAGANTNVSLEGTPGASVTLQVYCQSETETTYVSTTVSKTTTYKVVTLNAPAITQLSTSTVGELKFQLTHNNSYAVDIRYKIGSASYVTLSSVPPFDVGNPDSMKVITHTGTPGANVVIQAYSTKTGYTDSSVASKTLSYKNYPQLSMPYINLLTTPYIGEVKFRLYHNNSSNVNILYKRSTDSTWSTIGNAPSGDIYDRTYAGTPGANVTIQAKCSKTGYLESDIRTISTIYENGPGTINIPDSAVQVDTFDLIMQVYPPTAQTGNHNATISSQSVYDKASRQVSLTINANISIYDDSGQYSHIYYNFTLGGIPIYFKIGSGSWSYVTVPFTMGAVVGSGSGSQTVIYTLTQSDWNAYHSD